MQIFRAVTIAMLLAACTNNAGSSYAEDVAGPGVDASFPLADAEPDSEVSDDAGPLGDGDGDAQASGDATGTSDGVGADAPAADSGTDSASDGVNAGDGSSGSDGVVSEDIFKDGFSSPLCGEEDIVFDVDVVPPSILLVLDRSGSMYGGKWTATKAAVSTVLADKGPSMRFGLQLMPADIGCSVSQAAPEVDFGLDNGALINATLETKGTGGSTPMGVAMRAAYDHFVAVDPPGERYVILAADGKPSDTCLSDCSTCDCTFIDTCSLCGDLLGCVDAEVENAVVDLASIGAKTFVIGFEGGWGASELLDSLAEKGGTALSGDPKFYQAGDGSMLSSALGDIATEVSACNAELSPPQGYYGLVVQIDGETVPNDSAQQEGWDLLDGDVLQFYGAACGAASAQGADVKVTYLCKPTQGG